MKMLKTKILVVSATAMLAVVGCSSSQKNEVASNNNDIAAQRSPANYDSAACLAEAQKDGGCYFSNNDIANVLVYAKECKSIESKQGKTKVIFFRLASGKVVAVTSKDPRGQWGRCEINRIDTGAGDDATKQLAADGNHLYFRTAGGQFYYTTVDLKFYEIKSGSGRRMDITTLDETHDGVEIVTRSDPNHRVTVNDKWLSGRRAAGKVEKVSADHIDQFYTNEANYRSPFTN